MRKKIAALAATMLVAGGLTAVTVAPASAYGVCKTSVNTLANAQAMDSTWINLDVSTFLCTNVGIKHYAKPAGGPYYWTEEDTSPYYAYTTWHPELLSRAWRTF